MFTEFTEPSSHMLEALLVCHIVYQQGGLTVFVVEFGNSFIFLLASCIPNLQLQVFLWVLELVHFLHVGGPEGGLHLGVKFVMHISDSDAGFAHPSIPHNDQLGLWVFFLSHTIILQKVQNDQEKSIIHSLAQPLRGSFHYLWHFIFIVNRMPHVLEVDNSFVFAWALLFEIDPQERIHHFICSRLNEEKRQGKLGPLCFNFLHTLKKGSYRSWNNFTLVDIGILHHEFSLVIFAPLSELLIH